MYEALQTLYEIDPDLYQDIFLLILTTMDRKPCGVIYLICQCWEKHISFRNPYCVQWREENIILFDFLHSHQLYFHVAWDIFEDYETHEVWIFYGHTKEMAERAYLSQQKPYNHRELGLILGYPRTAIEVFQEDTFTTKQFPDELKSLLGEYLNFLYFAPSKEH